jgi:hypothetical protein
MTIDDLLTLADENKDAIEAWGKKTLREIEDAKRAARQHEILKIVLPDLLAAEVKFSRAITTETATAHARAAWAYARAVYPDRAPSEEQR